MADGVLHSVDYGSIQGEDEMGLARNDSAEALPLTFR